MIGLILCGGASRRFGHDKGLQRIAADSRITLAQRSVNTLLRVAEDPPFIDIVMSINPAQATTYSTTFPTTTLRQDDPELTVAGPLLGLLSAHLSYPNRDILLMACDMPELSSSLLQQLIAFHGGVGSVVAARRASPEPLCAIYGADDLSAACAKAQAGQLPNMMRQLVHSIGARLMHLQPDEERQLTNINTKSDLAQWGLLAELE